MRGATLQVGCQTPCVAPALFFCLCHSSLQPPPGQGGMSRALPRIVMAKFCQEYRNFNAASTSGTPTLKHQEIEGMSGSPSRVNQHGMYNLYRYTVLQRTLQILERTWISYAQAACAYHFVGREWIRHICDNGKCDFSVLISFAFEIRHSSLPCGSKLSFVYLRICTATSHQYSLDSE